MSSGFRKYPILGALIAAVTVLLAIRLLAFTREFSVNMMFWDQWDFYRPYFEGAGPLAVFRQQHGPHRQGLGGILIGVVASLTAWDGRGDAFLVAGTLVVATVLALWLKHRVIGTWSVFDLWIPALFLSLGQYELVTIVPNVAHSALPLALVLLCALAMTIVDARLQAVSLACLGPFLLYTGFGIFGGLLLPPLFLFRALWPRRSGFTSDTRPLWIGALAMLLIALVSFLADWRMNAAADCFVFPHPRPDEYLVFAGLMIGQAFGLAPLADQVGPANLSAIALGLSVAIAGAVILARSMTFRRGATIAFLIGVSLLFVMSTAVGRVCLGPTRQPLSSRYVTLTLPLILGIYLWAAGSSRVWFRTVGLGIGSLIVLSQIGPFFRDPYVLDAVLFRDARTAWKACYLAQLDPYRCNALVPWPMYPATDRIVARLRFLEANRLNLFNDAPRDVQIVSPADGSRVGSGVIELVGTVEPPGFAQYQLQWGSGEFPGEWNWLSGPHQATVRDGQLGQWDASPLPPGLYTLRLTAFMADGRQRVSRVTYVKP
jgi:hypothetical protein